MEKRGVAVMDLCTSQVGPGRMIDAFPPMANHSTTNLRVSLLESIHISRLLRLWCTYPEMLVYISCPVNIASPA